MEGSIIVDTSVWSCLDHQFYFRFFCFANFLGQVQHEHYIQALPVLSNLLFTSPPGSILKRKHANKPTKDKEYHDIPATVDS